MFKRKCGDRRETTVDKLVFGTDGWRDIIGDKFIFTNVARAAQAYADHLLDKGESLVIVGHDTRFNGDKFARVVAEVMAANGLKVMLSKTFIPTPAVSFAVKHYGAGGGVMLTASHNPPPYHGFKLKGPYGGTATQNIYADVSRRVDGIASSDVKVFDKNKHSIEQFDVKKAYFDHLATLIDVDVLKAFNGTIVHDAMGGAASGWLKGFLKHIKSAANVHEVHAVPNPMFYGVNPEPIPVNLASTMAVMQASDAVFATATDGDGDRLGIVLPGGEFFNSHQIFAVLIDIMAKRGMTGKIVKTFTVSRVIERVAKNCGIEIQETPVGFKYIVDAMLEGDVMVGGEESGGIGVTGHIPERDGIANSLLLLNAVASSGVSLKDIFTQLEQEAGWVHAYDRVDLHLQGNELKDAVMASLESPPEVFAGKSVTSVERRDGVKLNLDDDAWVLFRASGTEPVLRMYCEASDSTQVKQILDKAEAYVQSLA